MLDKKEFFLSASALARQVVETYILLLYCRHNEKAREDLLKEERVKGTTWKIVDNLKKSKIKIPYIKEITSDKFLDSVYTLFGHFSSIFHLSGKSLSQNMWIWNAHKNQTRTYIQDPELKENEKMIIFSKKSVISDEEIFELIHQFYTYSGLILEELNLIDQEGK